AGSERGEDGQHGCEAHLGLLAVAGGARVAAIIGGAAECAQHSRPGARPKRSLTLRTAGWLVGASTRGTRTGERESMGTESGLPLSDLRVLELGHIVAGPTAGLILADLGADVIKVERPDTGDQARHMPGGVSALYYFLNRNKRSIALDLKAAEGKALFLRLVETADVVLDNFSPGALDGLGLGYATLAERNPRLIYLSVKGFLPGPYEQRPSLDELAQMMGGLAYMTGRRGQPMRAGASIVDTGAATYGVIGVLAALRERDRTGCGQAIVAGLFETTVFWVGQWIAWAEATGQPSTPMSEIGQSQRMGWGIFHLFDTADEAQVFIGVTSN